MAQRQIVLFRPEDPDDTTGGFDSLGSLKNVLRDLAQFNTGPECKVEAGGSSGVAVLYGPGFVAQVPTMVDDVTQIVVTMKTEDFAFPVVMRICRTLGWRMMDPESGRVM